MSKCCSDCGNCCKKCVECKCCENCDNCNKDIGYANDKELKDSGFM